MDFVEICLLLIFLILVGVDLSLCIVVTISECYNLFSGVKLSIRSFCFIITQMRIGCQRMAFKIHDCRKFKDL